MLHARAVRRHLAGAADFADALAGREVAGARRRGKYLWLPVGRGRAARTPGDERPAARRGPRTPPVTARASRVHIHRRRAATCASPTSGRSAICFSSRAGRTCRARSRTSRRTRWSRPSTTTAFAAALRRRRTGIKRALLDQSLISGVGNIYADEALWRARLHWARADRDADTGRRSAGC